MREEYLLCTRGEVKLLPKRRCCCRPTQDLASSRPKIKRRIWSQEREEADAAYSQEGEDMGLGWAACVLGTFFKFGLGLRRFCFGNLLLSRDMVPVFFPLVPVFFPYLTRNNTMNAKSQQVNPRPRLLFLMSTSIQIQYEQRTIWTLLQWWNQKRRTILRGAHVASKPKSNKKTIYINIHAASIWLCGLLA